MENISRRPTRPIWIGPVQIGGGAPVSVQSMTNTDTRKVAVTVAQVQRLAAAGCEIDLFCLAEKAERSLLSVATPIKVAIMGCVVNGPGEAREADIGIAGGKKSGRCLNGANWCERSRRRSCSLCF